MNREVVNVSIKVAGNDEVVRGGGGAGNQRRELIKEGGEWMAESKEREVVAGKIF